MRSLEMTSWREEEEEEEDVEVEDMEMKHDGDMSESSSDEATSRKRRKHGGSASSGGGSSGGGSATRRRKTCISARERNLRRLESNERERMRMHSLNDAFEVCPSCPFFIF